MFPAAEMRRQELHHQQRHRQASFLHRQQCILLSHPIWCMTTSGPKNQALLLPRPSPLTPTLACMTSSLTPLFSRPRLVTWIYFPRWTCFAVPGLEGHSDGPEDYLSIFPTCEEITSKLYGVSDSYMPESTYVTVYVLLAA